MGVTVPIRRSDVPVVSLVPAQAPVPGPIHQATTIVSEDDAVEDLFHNPIDGIQTLDRD